MTEHNHQQREIFKPVSPESAPPKDHPFQSTPFKRVPAASNCSPSDDEHPSDLGSTEAAKNPESRFGNKKNTNIPNLSAAASDSPLHRGAKGKGRISRYAGFASIDSVLWWMTK